MDSNLVKQGNLHYYARGVLKKQWHKRYYVLYAPTESSQARLDYYESKDAFVMNRTTRKSIYLEEIQDFKPCTNSTRPYSFELVTVHEAKPYVLATESQEDLDNWMWCLNSLQHKNVQYRMRPNSNSSNEDENLIYDVSLNQKFPVEMTETESSRRLDMNGNMFHLIILSTNLLLQALDYKPLLKWPYKYIRRYGRSKETFTLEAGRKCQSGQGLFTFKCRNGEEIFQAVQRQTQQHSLAVQNSPTDITAPQLPERSYEKDELSFRLSSGSGNDYTPDPLPNGRNSGPAISPKPDIKMYENLPKGKTPGGQQTRGKGVPKPVYDLGRVDATNGVRPPNYSVAYQHANKINTNFRNEDAEYVNSVVEDRTYDVYDAAASSRFSGAAASPTEDEDLYEEAERVEPPQPMSIGQIAAALRSPGHEHVGSGMYDQLDLRPTFGAENTSGERDMYCEVGNMGHPLPARAARGRGRPVLKPPAPPTEMMYDEVGKN